MVQSHMPGSKTPKGVGLPQGCWLAGPVLQSMRIKKTSKIVRKLPIVKGLSKIFFMRWAGLILIPV